MKAFVINLKRRPDRLEEMQRNLGSINLPFERIEAVDARSENVSSEISHGKARIYARFDPPPIGQVGVYLSHRKIWQHILDKDISSALIFEDDVKPVDWDPAVLDVDISQYGLDHLRLLEYTSVYPGSTVIAPACTGQRLLGRVLSSRNTYGTGASIMTRTGAAKCLAAGKFWFNIDHFSVWSRIHGLRTALLEPPMFASTDSPTDVMDYRNPEDPARLGRSMARLVNGVRFALIASGIAVGKLKRFGQS